MKDLILTKNDGTVVGTVRTDMLSNSPANFTIMEMHDGSGNAVDSLNIIGSFAKKIAYSFAAFVQSCITNNLRIDAQDSNGTGLTNLLLNQKPSGTTYNIVSANGGTKTILVATDVHAAFLSADNITIYNSDNTIFGVFTLSADSTYSSPNTSIVVNETLATIGTNSGKYIKNNTH